MPRKRAQPVPPTPPSNGKDHGASAGVNEAAVRTRAYEIYETRGRESGREWEHWLQAERELAAAATPETIPRE